MQRSAVQEPDSLEGMKLSQHRIGSFVVTEHRWDVPVEHHDPSGPTLSVFAREVTGADAESPNRPWLVFLQGGPGFEATRPMGGFGWVERAARDYRVLLLDQRGTGRSSPIDAESIVTVGDADAQASYLRNFRADAIVRDCEFVRTSLGIDRWSVLGQSFGGFCLLHYLSTFPDSLREGFFTGGIPPIARPVDDIYRATYERMLVRNERFYERYPSDLDTVRSFLTTLKKSDVRLPSGDRLSVERYQMLGLMLGMSTGAEELHYLVERGLDFVALRGIENAQRWDTNPIYQVLHESSYADGQRTRWSAQRVRAEFPAFDDPDKPYFTGEHVYPWQLQEWQRLRPFADVAEILAEEPWPKLYDADTLARNTVPCAAAVYPDDPYVEYKFTLETADTLSALRMWTSDEHDHDALRVDGVYVLDELFSLVHGD